MDRLLARNDSERQRLLLEAQFYLSAVAKKRDDATAARDLKLEKIVTWLISVEILLSLLFGFLGLYEGYQQSKILDHMDKGTAATASAMSAARDSLQALAADQTKSLDRLQQMNDNLVELGEIARSAFLREKLERLGSAMGQEEERQLPSACNHLDRDKHHRRPGQS